MTACQTISELVNHFESHYNDVIMSTMASQITSLRIVYSSIYSGVDKRKYQSSVLLAFVRGIQRWLVNSRHKWPITRKMLPFDDVIMHVSCGCFSLVMPISKLIIHYNVTLEWKPQNLTNGQSTLVQVMAWCCQATTHYLNQCWPRPMSPYGITRTKCVKTSHQ